MSKEDEDEEAVTLGSGRALGESDTAIKVQFNSNKSVMWIPKNCLHDDSEVYSTKEDQNEGKIIVKMWWAERRGLV